MKRTLVILPAFNEEKVIGNVLKGLKKKGFKNILVVADCPRDNTVKVAKESGVIVLEHSINRGAGAATMTGIIYARQNNYDFVIIMDSDGQHDPEDALRLFKQADKYDVVLGARTLELRNMPFQRKIANFIGSILTYFFFGLYVRDSQSGFRVLNKKAIDKINLKYDRYEFASEMIGEIYRNNLSYKEFPIKVIYTDESKAKGQSIANGFKMLIRFIFRG